MDKIRQLFYQFYAKMQRKGLNSEYQFVPLGAIGFVSFIAYYFIWHQVAPSEYQNPYLRITGGLLCFFLMFKNYWPQRLKPFLPLYWYITLLYCFPFFFTFMLFKNPTSDVWLLTTMTGIFYLLILLDGIEFLIIILLGTALSWIYYVLTTDKIVEPTLFLQTLPAYATVIIAGRIFLHRTAVAQNEKLKTMKSLAASIAHELRTPLVAIRFGISGAKEYFPILVKTYDTAKENHLKIDPIKNSHLKTLLGVFDGIDSEIKYANTIIDMILMNVKQSNILLGDITLLSMNSCVDEAIARYPFKKGELELVEWSKNDDFLFKGEKILMVHVLFNLMRNSLYFIQAARKGKIKIWYGSDKDNNILYFKDTGKGIPKRDMSKLFEKFYSTTRHGTGLGLAYCKMAITRFGGTISCKSRYGEYTQFEMHFPRVYKNDTI